MADGTFGFLLKDQKHLKYVVCVTCSLSVLGSFLIILTYILFRKLRTNVRLVLLHLSIMDMGIGLSNLIGTAIDFNSRYYRSYNDFTVRVNPNATIKALCDMQAFVALYSTYGSVFWTNGLAVFLYFAVVHHNVKKNNILLWILTVFCYFMPLVLTLWLLLTHKLGPTPYGSGGWCSVINVDPSSGQRMYFSISFGYDLWIYATFILVPVLYIGTRAHISAEVRKCM